MRIIRDNKVITLTDKELEAAYREQQRQYRIDDIIDTMSEMFSDDRERFALTYGMDLEDYFSDGPFMDAVLAAYDKLFDKNLDEDTIMHTAIETTLKGRAADEDIARADLIDAVLLELPIDSGADCESLNTLANVIGNCGSDCYPIGVDSDNSWAIGFIRNDLVDDEYELEEVLTPAKAMMDDENLMQEHQVVLDTFYYVCNGVRVLITRTASSIAKAMDVLSTGPAAKTPAAQSATEQRTVSSAEDMAAKAEADADAIANEDDNAPVKRRFKLWARMGVTFDLDEDEVQRVLTTADSDDIYAITQRAIAEDRFKWDGDSYIPAAVVERLSEVLKLDAEDGDIDF